MIQKISIKNFKSVHSNEMELGRFNVLIGENGSGKSNILEAIAFGGAASANLLSNEFLASRGIRVTRPELMFSAFHDVKQRVIDFFYVHSNNPERKHRIRFHDKGGWVDEQKNKFLENLNNVFAQVLEESTQVSKKGSSTLINSFREVLEAKGYKYEDSLDRLRNNRDAIFNRALHKYETIDSFLSYFIIFNPEATALRNFFDEGQITPLGIRGEGLFGLLKEISQEKKGNRFKKIIESLKIIDWFDGFELETNGFPGEKVIKIKDKYMADSIEYIDQRSTNEGFLFLLFYVTLFISDKTPAFFAIDNIEASFNPKLCTKLIQVLAKLAKEHKKQVIVTTHNPFILDGLNLADDDQRLFVVRRNMEGHTITNRIQPKTKTDVPLSEAWMRGYLGGLPNNF